MTQPSVFSIKDNPDNTNDGEVLVERKFRRYTMFWAMSMEDLEALHTAIVDHLAGPRE